MQEQCPICRETPKHKQILECDHYYCYTCIKQWANISPRCPLCQIELDVSDFLDTIRGNSIKPQPKDYVKCPIVGCYRKVQRRNWRKHRENVHKTINCHKCSDKLMKHQLRDHLERFCLERTLQCPLSGCKEPMTARQLIECNFSDNIGKLLYDHHKCQELMQCCECNLFFISPTQHGIHMGQYH